MSCFLCYKLPPGHSRSLTDFHSLNHSPIYPLSTHPPTYYQFIHPSIHSSSHLPSNHPPHYPCIHPLTIHTSTHHYPCIHPLTTHSSSHLSAIHPPTYYPFIHLHSIYPPNYSCTTLATLLFICTPVYPPIHASNQ